jgi:hypothetical protein
MKHENDVEILFDAISENPDSYQEIVQHQDAIKSLERWPLIAAINGIASNVIKPSSEFTKEIAISTALESREALTEISSIPQIKLQKKSGLHPLASLSEVVITEKILEVREVFTSAAEVERAAPEVIQQASPQALEEDSIAKASETSTSKSLLALNLSGHEKIASQKISAIFDRLKHS